MRARLAAFGGVLYLLREERGTRVTAYDWDGRRLGEGFVIPRCDERGLELRGLAVDGDHRLWVADRRARALRAFSVFGVEVERFSSGPEALEDAPGNLDALSALAAQGVEQELVLLAASGGERRHALHVLGPDGAVRGSLRPLGDPQGRFHGVSDVAIAGSLVHVCEQAAGRIQVFRDGEFHYALRAAPRKERSPCAIAPLADGRVLAASAGEASALCLLDAEGRLEAVLAHQGVDGGEVSEPCSLVVEEAAEERHTRVAVVDQGGDRVQVFALDGRCFGSFPDLPCASF